MWGYWEDKEEFKFVRHFIVGLLSKVYLWNLGFLKWNCSGLRGRHEGWRGHPGARGTKRAVLLHPKQLERSAPHTNPNASVGSLRSHLTRRCSLCQVTSFGILGHLHDSWRPRLASGQVQPAGVCQGTKPTSTRLPAPLRALPLHRPWAQLIQSYTCYAFNTNSDGNMHYLWGVRGARSIGLGRP